MTQSLGVKRPRRGDDQSMGPGGCITLNVGGTIFQTTVDTLLSEPSFLMDECIEKFPRSARDSQGRPFFDRDPAAFRHILCYLRGYPLRLFPNEVALLSQEADYFGIYGLRVMTGSVASVTSPTFCSGAGVSVDGKVAQSSRLTSMVGMPLRPNESVGVTFRLEKTTRMCIGLVPEDIPLDKDIFALPHSVVYSSDGHVCCALGYGEGLSLAGASDGAPPPQSTEDTVAATQRSPLLVAEPLLQAQNMIAEAARNIHSSQGSDNSLSEFSKVPHHFSVPLAKADDEVSIAVNIGGDYETATIDFFKSNKWIANFNLQLCDTEKPNRSLKGRLQIAVYIQSGTTVLLKPFTVPPPTAAAGSMPTTGLETIAVAEIER